MSIFLSNSTLDLTNQTEKVKININTDNSIVTKSKVLKTYVQTFKIIVTNIVDVNSVKTHKAVFSTPLDFKKIQKNVKKKGVINQAKKFPGATLNHKTSQYQFHKGIEMATHSIARSFLSPNTPAKRGKLMPLASKFLPIFKPVYIKTAQIKPIEIGTSPTGKLKYSML